MWRGGGRREVFVYICKGVRRWAGAAGDLSLVDTVAMGELQFFVPALHLELFEGSRSGGGGVRCSQQCAQYREGAVALPKVAGERHRAVGDQRRAA